MDSKIRFIVVTNHHTWGASTESISKAAENAYIDRNTNEIIFHVIKADAEFSISPVDGNLSTEKGALLHSGLFENFFNLCGRDNYQVLERALEIVPDRLGKRGILLELERIEEMEAAYARDNGNDDFA